MHARASAIDRLAWAWFAVLAVAVAGPLLGSGYLLLLDFPSGPRFPGFALFPLPSSGDLGNGTPLLALHAALRAIHPYLRDKVFLLAPLILGGLGGYRLVRRHLALGTLPALYGATLFVLNPFVRDRFLAGHLHFLLAYSLLPWALVPVREALHGRTGESAPRIALWLALLAAVDIHIAGIYGLLVLAALAAAPKGRLLIGGVGLALAAALSAYWLLPASFTSPGAGIGPADLGVYASRPSGFAVLASLLSLHGFWRDEFPDLAERAPVLYALVVPILGLAAAGAARLLARREDRRFTLAVASTAALGLLLAAGTSFPPSAPAFRWLFEVVPFFGVYREPQKFLALVVLALSIFGAVGLEDLLGTLGRRPGYALALLAVACVLAYGGGMFWGFGGVVRLHRYPEGWAQADRLMQERGPGRLLVLPWHLYAVWSFSGGRIVANPGPSFFTREVLAAGEAGFPEVPAQSPDPFRRYIAGLLDHRRRIERFGHLVAPLGVRFVAWTREADWEAYRFLERQPDLRLVLRDERISLYENLAWRGAVYGLSPGEPLSSPDQLPGSGDEVDVTVALRPAAPPVPRQDDAFPGLARALPGWRTMEPTSGSVFVATTDRCTDGWRLGDRILPRCHLGAVAAFPRPDGPETLWRPLVGARLVGVAVSVLSIIGTGLYLQRVRRAFDLQQR